MDEKTNNDRSFGYRLDLTPKEMDKLLFCSRLAGLQVGDFLRKFIDDCYESILGNGAKNE